MCMLTASYPARNLAAWEQKIGLLLVTDLLRMNSSRMNRDGFGFGEVNGHFHKWEEDAGTVLFTADYNKILRRLINNPFIAHVRATSTGRTAEEGAHPFKVGELLLAHNGTFTNYKTILRQYTEQLPDKDPVDSHVITHLLADKVGTDALQPKHIIDAIGETFGSFALLITDTRSNSIWVVTGANSLYIQESGPLWLINTSEFNLHAASALATGTARLLYQKVWPTEVAVKIPEYTISVLTNKGLVARGELEKPTTRTYQQGVYTRHPTGTPWTDTNTIHKALSTEVSRLRAEYADAILKIPFMSRLELSLSCFTLFQSEWWKTDAEDLEILYTALSQISEQYGTPIKHELWEELMAVTKNDAYATIAMHTDMAFPYMLNSVEQLRSFLAYTRSIEEGEVAFANVSS